MICLVTGRGYGYVAVSRFKRRAGVHLYGKLRRTDFLPVGEDPASQYHHFIYDLLTYLLTYLLTHILIHLLSYSLTYLSTCLLTHSLTHSLTHLLLTYLPSYILTRLLSCLFVTYSLTSSRFYLIIVTGVIACSDRSWRLSS